MFYRNSRSDDTGQFDNGAVCWTAAQPDCTGSQLCERHWSTEWPHVPESEVQEEWDYGGTRYVGSRHSLTRRRRSVCLSLCRHCCLSTGKSSDARQLTVPRHRLSTYGRRAFAVAGPMAFNAMPDHLRDPSLNTTTFARSLKTHLFTTYQHA